MDCTIVDVFAERPLSGNQLAVVRGGAHLDAATMQAIALEMNFSETTFVVEERFDEARVRIFTPSRELPFAGHPTLGTAWVLERDRGSYTLEAAGFASSVDGPVLHGAPPELWRHTAGILADLGYGPEDFSALEREGFVQLPIVGRFAGESCPDALGDRR